MAAETNGKKKDVLSEGISLYKRGDFLASISFFLGLPDDSGADTIELAYYIGLCYAKLQRYEDALLYLEQVVTAGQNIDRVLQCRFLLAIIYTSTGRKKLADFELQKLLEAKYRPASVYSALAYNAWMQDEAEKSINFYKKALEIDPENATALNGLGYVLACENRDLTTALAYCKKALKKAPDSAACLDSVGWVYLKLGLMEDANKFLTLAREIMPESEEIKEHIRLAQVS
ncbi:MAG: tetratricopeptide repeat protein [Treponema sp.]|nr:tetratricopeptide repeat protein [Treponema sp.]